MADTVWYVYGIVPPTLDPGGAPEGVEDSAIRIEAHDGIAALVSELPEATYGPAPLERNTADVEWLGPRAVAHDRVLSWASDRAAVVPLPMFSLFSSRDAVRSLLRDQSSKLSAALARAATGREYALRVYRLDAELLAIVDELSERLGELRRTAESAAPGQRYLIERKLEAERKAELRMVGQRIAGEIFDALSTRSLDAVRSPIPQALPANAPGIMVLNAAFFVAPDAFVPFQRALSELVAAHDQRGFRFDFTGPWPAYHFVSEVAGGG